MNRLILFAFIVLAACSSGTADSSNSTDEGDLFLAPGESSCLSPVIDAELVVHVCMPMWSPACVFELRGDVLDNEGVIYQLVDDERESLFAAARLAVDGLEPGCLMCAPIADGYDPMLVQFRGDPVRGTYGSCADYESRRQVFLDAVKALQGPRTIPPAGWSWTGECKVEPLDAGILAEVSWGGADNDLARVTVTDTEVVFVETFGAEPVSAPIDETQRDYLLAEIAAAVADLPTGCTDCEVNGDHLGYFKARVGESDLWGIQSVCEKYEAAVNRVEAATRAVLQ